LIRLADRDILRPRHSVRGFRSKTDAMIVEGYRYTIS